MNLNLNISREFGSSGAVAATTPQTIFGSLAWWYRADLGVTVATGVSTWADQSGNNVNMAQASGPAQPALIASAINGQPAVRADGISQVLSATWARVAPGTQPFYLCFVAKQISWVALNCLAGDFGATGMFISADPASPQIDMFNTTNANAVSATLGTYLRIEMQFTGSTADYMKAGSAAAVTGANSGNNAGGGTLQLFNRGGSVGGRYGNWEIAEAFGYLGTASGGQRSSNDTYITGRYGAGLT